MKQKYMKMYQWFDFLSLYDKNVKENIISFTFKPLTNLLVNLRINCKLKKNSKNRIRIENACSSDYVNKLKENE